MVLKYIIVESAGLELPRFCSQLEEHQTLLKAGEKVLAGGFCEISSLISSLFVGFDTNDSCYGESVGLKVKSREKIDAEIIKSVLRIDMT